jgi:hypothetical protein
MKIEEVPQDSKFFEGTVIRDIAYAVDKDGKYTSVVSEGWEVKNDALDLALGDIEEKCEEIRQEVIAGNLSPLAYHMEKNLMSLSLLSNYTGFFKMKIRKHLKPGKFEKLEEKTLRKYADALRISIEELKKV